MVYKYHQFIRDRFGLDSSIWPDDEHRDQELRSRLNRLRKSHPRIPYTLEIECNTYWGNFEREFIAYSMGILDDVQMNIGHSEEELAMFWDTVFGKKALSFEDATESYELLRDYLLETYQDVDDWWQLTFYSIDWNLMHKENREVLVIQLAKPLSEYWENIIIPRMKEFFVHKPYKYMDKNAKLSSIRLLDRAGIVVKEY